MSKGREERKAVYTSMYNECPTLAAFEERGFDTEDSRKLMQCIYTHKAKHKVLTLGEAFIEHRQMILQGVQRKKLKPNPPEAEVQQPLPPPPPQAQPLPQPQAPLQRNAAERLKKENKALLHQVACLQEKNTELADEVNNVEEGWDELHARMYDEEEGVLMVTRDRLQEELFGKHRMRSEQLPTKQARMSVEESIKRYLEILITRLKDKEGEFAELQQKHAVLEERYNSAVIGSKGVSAESLSSSPLHNVDAPSFSGACSGTASASIPLRRSSAKEEAQRRLYYGLMGPSKSTIEFRCCPALVIDKESMDIVVLPALVEWVEECYTATVVLLRPMLVPDSVEGVRDAINQHCKSTSGIPPCDRIFIIACCYADESENRGVGHQDQETFLLIELSRRDQTAVYYDPCEMMMDKEHDRRLRRDRVQQFIGPLKEWKMQSVTFRYQHAFCQEKGNVSSWWVISMLLSRLEDRSTLECQPSSSSNENARYSITEYECQRYRRELTCPASGASHGWADAHRRVKEFLLEIWKYMDDHIFGESVACLLKEVKRAPYEFPTSQEQAVTRLEARNAPSSLSNIKMMSNTKMTSNTKMIISDDESDDEDLVGPSFSEEEILDTQSGLTRGEMLRLRQTESHGVVCADADAHASSSASSAAASSVDSSSASSSSAPSSPSSPLSSDPSPTALSASTPSSPLSWKNPTIPLFNAQGELSFWTASKQEEKKQR